MLDQPVGRAGAGAVGADKDLAPVAARDLRERVSKDGDVLGDGVRARIPRSEHRGQALERVRAPRRERMKPPRTLIYVPIARSFLDEQVIAVASRSMTDQPTSSRPRITSQGNPVSRWAGRPHTRERTSALGLAILTRARSSISPSIRHSIESEAPSPTSPP